MITALEPGTKTVSFFPIFDIKGGPEWDFLVLAIDFTQAELGFKKRKGKKEIEIFPISNPWRNQTP